MPVQIGVKTHDFTDPTGLLSDCHRRIEIFLGMLKAVAQDIDHFPTEETRRALEASLRYFRQSAPNYTADEAESLFPRLRQLHHAEIQAAYSKLEQLEEEHCWAAPLHAEVDHVGAKYLATGNLSSSEVDGFRRAVANLASMYKQHTSLEDSVVFPLAARVLSCGEKMAIAEEMEIRKRVKVVTEVS